MLLIWEVIAMLEGWILAYIWSSIVVSLEAKN